MTDLELCKKHKIQMINQNSESIINMGYYCSTQDVILAMTDRDIMRYHILDVRSDTLTFPIYLRTRDMTEYAVYNNASELHTFMDNAFLWSVNIEGSGGALIQSILACTTIEQVNSIVDSRTWEDFI